MSTYGNDRWYEQASSGFEGSPFEKMVFAGADFLKQRYSVGFATRDTSLLDKDEMKIAWTRFATIQIPQLKAKSFTLKTPIGQVDKVASKFEGQYETTMSLRADDSLVVFDFFGKAGNNSSIAKSLDGNCSIYPLSMSSFSRSLIDRNARLDIVVLHGNSAYPDSAWINTYRDRMLADTGSISAANEPLPGDKLMCWVLEDVKIAEAGQSLQLSRDGDGPQTLSVKLTFKRLARLQRD